VRLADLERVLTALGSHGTGRADGLGPSFPQVALIPTLSFWRYQMRHDRISAADAVEQSAVNQLRSWVAAGGPVLYGTDLGWVTIYDPTVEYVLMNQAMTFPQMLASLTTAPAERFGDGANLGKIAPGFLADIAVVHGDPSKDIRALAAIDYTIRDGQVIYRLPAHASR